MKIVGVIPARYASTRFPGKPLADIHGKPMIWWVYQQAKEVSELNEVYVATENDKISEICKQFSIPVVMTSDKHPTGTDRVTEVAEKVAADWYVNIQGDEPLIEPEIIQAVLKPVINKEDVQVVALMSEITDPVDVINPTIVKVITNESGRCVYCTRSVAPFPFRSIDHSYYKHLGVYVFSTSALSLFKDTPRGRIERIEEIEILRFIENGYYVKFIEVKSKSIAVDTLKDLEKVSSKLSSETIKGRKCL